MGKVSHRIVAALLATSLPAQAVWIVDDDPGPDVDFAAVQAAVDAAAAGDTILVRSGEYPSFFASKPLRIVADRDATVRIDAPVTVSNIDAGQSFVLQGFLVQQNDSLPMTHEIFVFTCSGAVRIEDCVFDPGPIGAVTNLDTVLVLDCAAIILDRVEADGQYAAGFGVAGGNAIAVDNSVLHLFDCRIDGGRGSPAAFSGGTPPFPGGAALQILDSTVFAHGTTATGGIGGGGAMQFGCVDGAPGGPSARLLGSSSTLQHLDSTWTGGPGGSSSPPCASGAIGSVFEQFSGTITSSNGSAYRMSTDRVAREGQSMNFVFSGPPGNSVTLALAAAPTALFVPVIESTLALDPVSFTAIPLGLLDATGTLVVPTVLSPLAPGTTVLTLHTQVFGLGVMGVHAGSGQTLTLLEP